MPFETGFGQDDGLEKEDKQFEDIYEEEFTVERFQRMERRIMVQWVILLALVLALASFMAVNFTTRLSKIADKGDVQVDGLSKTVNEKVESIMQELDGAEKELVDKIASVNEKAQQVGALLDKATKTIEASKVDRSEVTRLFTEERKYTDEAVHNARVKTDRFKASVLETLNKKTKALETEFDKKIAGLDKKQTALNVKAENLEDKLGVVQKDAKTALSGLTQTRASDEEISKQMETLKEELGAFRVEQEAVLAAAKTEMDKSLKRTIKSLESRLAAMEKTLKTAAKPSVAAPVSKPAATPPAPSTKPSATTPKPDTKPEPATPPAVTPKPKPSPGGGGFVEQDLGD